MRIIWSPLALDDLRGIDDRLTREATPDFAVRTPVTIRNRARILANFPRAGRPIGRDHRILRVYDTAYSIRYRIVDSVAKIVRVHHDRENWQLVS